MYKSSSFFTPSSRKRLPLNKILYLAFIGFKEIKDSFFEEHEIISAVKKTRPSLLYILLILKYLISLHEYGRHYKCNSNFR